MNKKNCLLTLTALFTIPQYSSGFPNLTKTFQTIKTRVTSYMTRPFPLFNIQTVDQEPYTDIHEDRSYNKNIEQLLSTKKEEKPQFIFIKKYIRYLSCDL